MNVGFTFSDNREYFDSDAAINDPTDVDKRDGGQIFFGGTSYMNSRWTFKLDGMYQLPYGINIAGKFNGRQGYPWIETFRTDNRAGDLGRAEVLLQPEIGSKRLDNLWYMDIRVEKAFDFGRYSLECHDGSSST